MNKGISLVSLMVTIVIIILLTTTVVVSATSSINNSKKITFATEISFIQEAVNNYYTKNNNVPVLGKIEIDLNDVKDLAKKQFSDEKQNPNIELYILDMTKLGRIETIYGNSTRKEDIYAVSLDTRKVYYVSGLSLGDNIYYTLTDDLKSVIRYNESKINDGIIFKKSNDNWTNETIKTEVFVPTEYLNVKVIANEKDILSFENSDNYKKYNVSEIIGNYNITVMYEKKGVSNKLEYSISNFDNIAPKCIISSKKVLDSGIEKYNYMEISELADDLSGIKKAKYLKSNATLDEVKENGIDIQGDIIEFDENVKYITIYVEDNATNYYYNIIDLRGE